MIKKLVNPLDSILFLLTIFLFFFISLYPKFPLANIAGTFVAVRLEDIFIALLILLWAIHIFLQNKVKSIFSDNINKAILLFFFVGSISIFSAIFLTHSVVSHLGILHFFRRIEFMLLLPVVATVVNTRKKLLITLMVIPLVLLAVNFYALGQQFLGWPVISTTNSEFSKGLILSLSPGARVNSTFAGHYDLAVFLAMALVLMTPLFFAVNKKFKVGILFLAVLSLLVLIMTSARLSFAAAFAGIIIALVLSKKKKYVLIILAILIGILVYPSELRDRFVSTLTVNILNMGQRYEGKTNDQKIRSKLNIPTVAIKTSSSSAQTATFATSSGETATDITPGEPIDTTQLGVYRSFQIRLNIEWPRAINALIKNPFLGTGYSSLGIATDNDFLRSLGEVGILGTMSFILVLIAVGKRIKNLFNSEKRLIKYFSLGVFSMMLAFIINGLFIDVFEASKVASYFWMILGLNLAAGKFK